MVAKDRLIVALDFPTYQEAHNVAEGLGEHVWGFKVGLELIHSKDGGPKVVSGLQAWASANIFYDCKLKDTPNTVAGAVRNIIPLGVKMFTVHCLGGFEMMRLARKTAQEESRKLGVPCPLILGVTILTTLNFHDFTRMGLIHQRDIEEYWRDRDRVQEWLTDRVITLTARAMEAHLDGVIASAHETQAIREIWPDGLIVTPAIRSSSDPPDDQKRTATVAEAIRAGADYLVVGRPITGAPDPAAAATRIIREIEEALDHKSLSERSCPTCGGLLPAGGICLHCSNPFKR